MSPHCLYPLEISLLSTSVQSTCDCEGYGREREIERGAESNGLFMHMSGLSCLLFGGPQGRHMIKEDGRHK